MRRIGIVGSARNETSLELVLRWRALGLDAHLMSAEKALARLGPEDVAVARLDVRQSLDGVEPGLLLLLSMARLGTTVVNRPEAVVAAHDKLRTARLLDAAQLPHPRTEHVQSGRVPLLAPPFVLKPRFGSWGRDVVRCETRQDARQALEALSQRHWFHRHGALAQELLPIGGYDVRVLVARGVMVGSAERVAAPGEWRSNISLGGSLRRAAPTPAAAALAVAAVSAVGGDFFGVDLIPVRDGYAVLEVNAAIEFDDRYSLAGGDVYADVAGALGFLERAPAVPALPQLA